MQFGKSVKHLWHLDPSIVFLNNGSFGATPKSVLEAVRRYDEMLESEPVRFYLDIMPELLDRSREALSRFLKVKKEDLVLTDNATTAVNTILNNLQKYIGRGDALLFTNHVYPAVRNTLNHISELTGAELIEVHIGYPTTKEEIISNVEASLKSNVRLAIFDHISSPTAMIFPVKELTELCHRQGAEVLIDGAHAPGMIEPEIEAIGAEWYVANLHKWLFAPKSCAMIVTKKSKQEGLHPLVISLDYGSGYEKEFSWVGTRNFASQLAIYDAVNFYEELGAEKVMQYNHRLVLEGGEIIGTAVEALYSKDESMIGSMLTLKLPELKDEFKSFKNTDLRDFMLKKHSIEVPFMMFDGEVWLRISAQVFNEKDEYGKLAEALKGIVQ